MHRVARFAYAAAGSIAESAASLVPANGGKFQRTFRVRKGVLDRFAEWGDTQRDRSRPLLWVHAPSVGEGLQARPVLEALRERLPAFQLAYTYFSPSAEHFAKTLDVDFRDVLPFDTVHAARAALDALAPAALIFSKLDVWPMLTEAAAARRIPLALISATLASGSSRSGRFASAFLRDAYARLDAVGAISADDASRLIELGCREPVVRVTGDTRFDQVILRARRANADSDLLAPLRSTRPTLVVGSNWPTDERVLLPAIADARGNSGLRVIIAPHEPTAQHLGPIERWASSAGLAHARLGSARAPDADVVVVDRVGVLGELYSLADFAFVGGAFHSAGLHSVLEPAAYGAPVIFGPRHGASRDARLLLEAGGAQVGHDRASLAMAIRTWIADRDARRAAGAAARRVVEENAGATQASVALVEPLLERRRILPAR